VFFFNVSIELSNLFGYIFKKLKEGYHAEVIVSVVLMWRQKSKRKE
jgi:hypothetical protein